MKVVLDEEQDENYNAYMKFWVFHVQKSLCSEILIVSGKVKLLIATSVAARGLDVKQLILVINYDCPNHYEDYVHRCGRTGRAGNKGFAYTFITPEQSRYAGDIIRAFELASVTVPEQLRTLWESYKSKQEAEGKKVHTGGGFSGKGFKFDENEAAAVNEKKKFQKAALGLVDSDDEDLEHDIDQQIESMFATKRTVKEIKAPLGKNNLYNLYEYYSNS